MPIEAQTVSQMVDRVMAMKEGTRLLLLAPVVRDRKGEYRKELAELQRRGFTRVKVDGTLYEIGEVPALNRKIKHEIEAVVDRVVVRDGIQTRLADSFESALALSDGVVYVEDADDGRADGVQLALRLPGQRLHDRGDRAAAVLLQLAARRLPGLRRAGRRELLRPGSGGAGRAAAARGRRGRALGRAQSPYYDQTLQSLARHFKVSTRTPWDELPERVRDAMLHGTGETPIEFSYKDGVRAYSVTKPFEGVLHNLQRRWQETDSAWVREEMSRYQAEKPCAVCHGARLKPEALAVRVAGQHIAAASDLSIRRALGLVRGRAGDADAAAAGDRAADPARDRRAAAVPGRCRARLPDAVPRQHDAVRAARASASGWRARSARG